MNNKLCKRLLGLILLVSLTACETGIFVRPPHYYHNDHNHQPVSWGYTTGEPMLEAGYGGNYGNFYPQAVQVSEGAVPQ